jgi:hypothetical protein
MFEALKLLLCKLLRIPPEPTDPLGSASSVLVFRASINYYRYKLLKWFFGAFAGLLVAVAISGVLAFEASSSYQKGGGGVHALEFLIAAIVLTGGAVFKAAISSSSCGSTTKCAGTSSPTAASASGRASFP